jgi:hypothetical protein
MTHLFMKEFDQPYSASTVLANSLNRQSHETRPFSNANSEISSSMDWEMWASDVKKSTSRLTANLDRLIWGGIGALIGTAIVALPAFLVDFHVYPFVVVQPLGAAAGALAAIYLMSEER